MEHWYLPVTIIPGIGLLILSTSNLLVTLSTEINGLLEEEVTLTKIITHKLKQLKRLNNAMVFLYIAVALFVIAGLFSGVSKSMGHSFNTGIYITIAGIISALFGLLILILYSFKAVKIRQEQFAEKVK